MSLPVTYKNLDPVAEAIGKLYNDNKQSSRTRTETAYEKIDPAILWFINTTGCQQFLILILFLCEKVYKAKKRNNMSCNACMYAHTKNRNIPGFALHHATAQMSIRYEQTEEYMEYMRSAEQTKLLAIKAAWRCGGGMCYPR